MADRAPWIVAVATYPEVLSAHERTGEIAINVIGWAVDNSGGVHALAVASDGSTRLVPIDSVVFDHAVRPTDY